MTAQTPIYGLEYLVPGEPARNTRAALEANAFTIEAALQAGGVAAPGASDLLAVSGRVSTLETAAAARRFAVLLGGSGTTALADGAWTVLPLTGVEEADPLNGHSTVTNTSRWTCPAGAGGWYSVVGTSRVDNGTGRRSIGVRRNGVDVNRATMTVTANAATAVVFGSVPALILLNPTDYVEVAMFVSGTGLAANNAWSSMTLYQVYPS